MAGVFAQLAARGAGFASRLPVVGGVLSRGLGSTPLGTQAGQALRTSGGVIRNVAGLGLPGPAGTAARAFTGFTLGTSALGAGQRLLGGGSQEGPALPPGFAGGGVFGGDNEGMLAGILAAQGGMITKVWQPTPTSPVFAKLDYPGSKRRSKILFQRRDGTIGTYTPQKMIVLSRNPRVKDLARAAKRIDKLTQSAVQMPKQTSRSKKRMSG